MTLGHEKLDVYRLSIGYVAWVYEKAETLIEAHRPAPDRWLRASQSIPLNIAEGNDKTAGGNSKSHGDRSWNVPPLQDVLVVGKTLDKPQSQSRKVELGPMAAMLGRLGGRGYRVREDQTSYGDERNDFDSDPDPDFDSGLDEDANEPQLRVGGDR